MQRFLRGLWTTFAGVSFLLCLATATIWVRSYFVSDGRLRTAGDWRMQFYAVSGRLGVLEKAGSLVHLWYRDEAWQTLEMQRSEHDSIVAGVGQDEWSVRFPGFGRVSQAVDYTLPEVGGPRSWAFGATQRFTFVHLAYPTAVFAIAPLAWSAGLARRRRRERRARIVVCTKCGCDLSGSPDRCPECGAPPAR